jgi:hypothetical protein
MPVLARTADASTAVPFTKTFVMNVMKTTAIKRPLETISVDGDRSFCGLQDFVTEQTAAFGFFL